MPPSVDKAVENLTDKPTQVIGKGVAAMFSLVFNPIIHFNDKKQAKYMHALEIYEKGLQTKVAAIPEENLIEPKLQIVAQALEDSKYCVEEPSLRDLFENLVASASDNRKADAIHPSFSTILKQMSPQDAAVMQRIKQGAGKYGSRFPVARLKYIKPSIEGEYYLTNDIMIPDPSAVSKTLSSDSLSNLSALGLISIDYSEWLVAKEAYEVFDQYAEANGYKAQVEQVGGKIEIGKGICGLTPYGQNFAQACGL